MKRFLGTIFLLAFFASAAFMSFGCGPKDTGNGGDGNGDGNGAPIPTAEEKEELVDEVLDEG